MLGVQLSQLDKGTVIDTSNMQDGPLARRLRHLHESKFVVHDDLDELEDRFRETVDQLDLSEVERNKMKSPKKVEPVTGCELSKAPPKNAFHGVASEMSPIAGSNGCILKVVTVGGVDNKNISITDYVTIHYSGYKDGFTEPFVTSKRQR